jgi:hypothetical protein
MMVKRLWRILIAYWNAKFYPLQFEKLPEPKKEEAKSVYKPTEIFPELVYWKVGDPIHEVSYDSWGCSRIYQGVSEDGTIYMHFLGHQETTTVHALKRGKYVNGRLEKKRIDGELGNDLMKDIARFQELSKENKLLS